jgi:hypothetical protein
MKHIFVSLFIGLLAMSLLTGCVLNIGGGRKACAAGSDEHPVVGQPLVAPTVGQQLIDLQKAKEVGAITDKEYQDQRAKLLESK